MKYLFAALILTSGFCQAGSISELFPELKPVPGKQDYFVAENGKQYDAEELVERAAKFRIKQLKADPTVENAKLFYAVYFGYARDSEIMLPYLAEAQKAFPDLTAQALTKQEKETLASLTP